MTHLGNSLKYVLIVPIGGDLFHGDKESSTDIILLPKCKSQYGRPLDLLTARNFFSPFDCQRNLVEKKCFHVECLLERERFAVLFVEHMISEKLPKRRARITR